MKQKDIASSVGLESVLGANRPLLELQIKGNKA
jgi:hypothetical protein